jgi:hypothetical protein
MDQKQLQFEQAMRKFGDELAKEDALFETYTASEDRAFSEQIDADVAAAEQWSVALEKKRVMADLLFSLERERARFLQLLHLITEGLLRVDSFAPESYFPYDRAIPLGTVHLDLSSPFKNSAEALEAFRGVCEHFPSISNGPFRLFVKQFGRPLFCEKCEFARLSLRIPAVAFFYDGRTLRITFATVTKRQNIEMIAHPSDSPDFITSAFLRQYGFRNIFFNKILCSAEG